MTKPDSFRGEWWRRASGLRRVTAWLMTALIVAGCSIFGGGDDDELQPTELLDFKQVQVFIQILC